MEEKKMLPIGIEDFKTVVEQCYYVDKTKLISDILKSQTEQFFFLLDREDSPNCGAKDTLTLSYMDLPSSKIKLRSRWRLRRQNKHPMDAYFCIYSLF